MRDKTEAARLLMEAGWSFEEVAAALGGEKASPVGIPLPQPWPMVATPNYWPWWTREITISGAAPVAVNGVPTLTS